MDVFIVDSAMFTTELVEGYESLIWTERFKEVGDFDLQIIDTPSNRLRLKLGTWISIQSSDRIMTIETVENTISDDNVAMLNLRGRSIESLMEDRAAVYTMLYNANFYKYYQSGTPSDIIRTLFYATCYLGQVAHQDTFPHLQPHSFAYIDPQQTAREPSQSISHLIEPESVLAAIKKLCELYELGFKIIRPPGTNGLYFYTYPGLNRSSNQNVNSPIIFSRDLENIQNTKELQSDQLVKNVAYVVTSAINLTVYAPGVDPSISGFNRKVVTVDAGDRGAPPNAGQYPERPPEPDYGLPVVVDLPDFGHPNLIPEPDWGYPPEGMEGRALWMEQHEIDYQNWIDQNEAIKADHAIWRQLQIDNWRDENEARYNTWHTAMLAERQLWIDAYDAEVAAWHAENARLYDLWISEMAADMLQKGNEELAKYKKIDTYDGEINERGSLLYKTDYDLGDIVELRDDDGGIYARRVTEQIFVSDKEGERSYPTFSETKRTT